MIICNREQANSLLKDSKNLLKDDIRNQSLIDHQINYQIISDNKDDYEIKEIKRGRGEGVKNVEPEIRKLIAEEALVSGKTQAEIAAQFGISPQSVEAYVNGSTSLATYNHPNEELAKHVDATKLDLADKAKNKLLTALESLTDSKIGGAKAKDIASIAKDMSSVVKNMTVDKSGPTINNKILVYQPRVKEEDDYEVVDAIEE